MNKLSLIYRIFYLLKPIIPRRIQLWLRTQISLNKRKKFTNIWPIDYNSAKPPPKWGGWPEGKNFAVILTHDVESDKGHDSCLQLMNAEKRMGFKSSFNFVPEKYSVSVQLRNTLVENGYEVGVHGLNHDGRLFSSRSLFTVRAKKINKYLELWDAVGFRAPAMHHNLKWIHDLNIEYDLSTFDTDPFEPQSDGVGTIFPFVVQSENEKSRYIEMPYTLPQDFLIFILMREKSCDIWKNKLDWIVKNKGMVLVNVHPDYISFETSNVGREEFPLSYYEDFLNYINERYEGQFWNALPREMSQYWNDLDLGKID